MKKSYMTGFLMLVVTNVIFGITDAATPLAYTRGSNVYAAVFLMKILGAFVLLAILIAKRQPLTLNGSSLKMALLLGFLDAFTTVTLYMSISLVGAGMGTMLHMCHTVVTSLCEARIRRSRIKRVTLAALVVILAGIFFMLGGDGGRFSLLGVLLGLISGVGYASLMLVLGNSSIKEEPPLNVSLYVSAVSGLFVLLYARLAGGGLHLAQLQLSAWVVHLVCAVLGGFVARILIQLGILYSSATLCSLLGALEPLTSTVLGVVLLGEGTTPLKLLGCALILLGVLLEPLSDIKKKRLQALPQNK